MIQRPPSPRVPHVVLVGLLMAGPEVALAGPHLLSCAATGSSGGVVQLTLTFDQAPGGLDGSQLLVGAEIASSVQSEGNTLRVTVSTQPSSDSSIELGTARLGTFGQCSGPPPRLSAPLSEGDPWWWVTAGGQHEIPSLSMSDAVWGYTIGPRTADEVVIAGRSVLLVYDVAADRLGPPLRSRFFSEGADAQSGMLRHPTLLAGGDLLAGQQVDDGLFLFDLRGTPHEIFPAIGSCSSSYDRARALFVVATPQGRSQVIELRQEGALLEAEVLFERARAAEPPPWLATHEPGAGVPCTGDPLQDYARTHLR